MRDKLPDHEALILPLHVMLAMVAGGALIAALITPAVRRFALQLGLVDHPAAGAYKTHLKPMPYGGGIAIYCGAAAGILALIGLALVVDPLMSPGTFFALVSGLESAHLVQTLALFLCGSAVFLVGLMDDWVGLSPLVRLIVQLMAASALVWGVPGFSLPLTPTVPLLAPLSTIVWIVAVTNAFNFLDNMDGLAAGMSVIVFTSIGVMALWTSHLGMMVLSLTLAGACAGFLIFNFPRASIFMGDAGGLFLGFAAASMTALLSHHLEVSAAAEWPRLLAPLAVLSVAVYDQLTVVASRLLRGVPPWLGDTNHVSHRLVRLGLSRRNAVLVIHGMVALTGILALGVLTLAPADAGKLMLGGAVAVTLLGAVDYAAARRGVRKVGGK